MVEPQAGPMEVLRDRLQAYLRRHLDRAGLELSTVDAIPEGHSGFTYFVSIDDGGSPRRFVLRLPPPGARIAGPADVVRQGRIMAALHDAGLPTPAVPVLTSDAVVDGRPFVLMDAVEGTRIEKAGVEQRPLDIAASAVRVLKNLHALPLERTGIGDESPVGLQAEMLRWLQYGLCGYLIAGLFGSYSHLTFPYVSLALLWSASQAVRAQSKAVSAAQPPVRADENVNPVATRRR